MIYSTFIIVYEPIHKQFIGYSPEWPLLMGYGESPERTLSDIYEKISLEKDICEMKEKISSSNGRKYERL